MEKRAIGSEGDSSDLCLGGRAKGRPWERNERAEKARVAQN